MAGRVWPPFSDVTNIDKTAHGWWEKGKEAEEDNLLDGLISGVEVSFAVWAELIHARKILLRPALSESYRSAPHTVSSLAPASAQPLLSTLFRPPSSSSRAQSYLIGISSAGSTTGARKGQSRTNWDSAWDETGWDGLAAECRAKDIRCSSILVGTGDHQQHALSALCQAVSSSSQSC